MSWTLRFVSDTTDARTTRLDLNDASADPSIEIDDYEGEGQLDFGEAGIERTLSDPEGRDGQVVTSSKRPNREVQIPLLIHGNGGEFAAAMSALSRECDRASNYLEWSPGGGAEPVFFVVHQGVISNPDTKNSAANVWTCDLTLMCDPAAIGPKITQTILDVSNDPAAAAKAQGHTLPAILGDLPAPLSVVASGTTMSSSGNTTLISLHTHETSFGRVLRQCEAGATLSGDTTVQANSPVMSGAGSNYLRCTFASTTAMLRRFAFDNLSMDFGSYKVMLRVRKSAAASTFRVRWRHISPIGGSQVLGSTVDYGDTGPSNAGPHWLDLGTISVPSGGAAPEGVTSGDIGTVNIEAERVSASGSLDFDCLIFLPVERPDAPEVHMSATWFQYGAGTNAVYGWDADRDIVWTYDDNGYGMTALAVAGSLPVVYPGYTNRLVFMRHASTVRGGSGTIAPDDDITWTSDLEVSYNPRYLFVAAP